MLSNAIKYSPAAEKVIVNATVKDEQIQLCIQDFGIGISAQNQSKIFEQFFRVTGVVEDTFPGLGLGMYISSEIIKKSNGTMWLESEDGKGSTFCFILPVSK
jgi:signal transduction histidine kinase